MFRITIIIALLGMLATPLLADTIEVDASGGGDYTDLAAAIAAAQDGDTITVAPGTYTTSVVIEKSLTIAGQGNAELVILDGAGQRIMLLQGDHEVQLRDLCLQDGHGDSGGAILSWQGMDLTVEDCIFRDNHADWGGGAIEARAITSNLILRDCIFENNVAGNHAGGVATAFGINCEIDHCLFEDNTATAMAGAFTAFQSGAVTIHHTVFEHNIGGDHGAVYLVDCGGNYITSCTFHRTVAGGHATILVHNASLLLRGNIIASTFIGGGVEIYDNGFIVSEYNLFWDNAGGDWIGGDLGPSDAHADPQFCDPTAGDLAPCYESYAVVGTEFGLLGALPPGCPCGVVRVENHSWTAVKQIFR